jgi:hypothetical protein
MVLNPEIAKRFAEMLCGKDARRLLLVRMAKWGGRRESDVTRY